MPLAITADETNLFQLGSRLPAGQEAQVQAAQQAAAEKLAAQQAQLPPTAEAPAAAAAAAAPEAAPAAADAGAGAAVAGAAAGAAAGGMLGGMLRALTGGRSEEEKKAAAAKKAEEKAAKEAEKAAREAEKQAAKEAEAAAAQAAAEAAAREAEAAAAAAAAHDAELTAAAAAAAAAIAASQGRGSPSPVQSFTSTDMPSPVLVTPPGGGPPIPMLPLAVPPSDVQDPNLAFQLGMQAGVAAAMKAASPAPAPAPARQSSSRRPGSNTPSRSGSISGDRPPRQRREGSFSGASAHGDRSRRAGSVSGRSETGSETGRPRGFAPGEEEEADNFALGSVEQAPAALRAPSAGVCAAFVSDRQKHETAPADSPLTKIVLERTAHLRPGSQFIKSFWMTEGVRCTNTSVVRNAVHKVNKQPVSIKFYGRMEDFNRERQLYSLAISPQFVPMMYFCEEGSEDLPPFVITERGDFTLAEVLRKSRPPPQQQKILLHDVACALSQLHSMGLVQMDIRPANVMFFGCGVRGWAGGFER
jgi:hypothetical protein